LFLTVRLLPLRHPELLSLFPLTTRSSVMLWTIAVIIFILWLLGAFVMPVGGSLIHILLVVAIIVVLYRIITGRKPIP